MINVDDYTQPVETVIAQERNLVFSRPLKVESYKALFDEWCEVNPRAIKEIEMTALAIDRRGLRVSTKYLIEKQRYEGRSKLVAVPYVDQRGNQYEFNINNTVTPLLARLLLSRHPEMRIETRKSMFDIKNRKENSQCFRENR